MKSAGSQEEEGDGVGDGASGERCRDLQDVLAVLTSGGDSLPSSGIKAVIIESALEGVTAASHGTQEVRSELIKKLEDVIKDESLKLNAKLRRKVKRLSEVLQQSLQAHQDEGQKNAEKKFVVAKQTIKSTALDKYRSKATHQTVTITPTATTSESTEPIIFENIPLEETIEKVRTLKDATELEDTLAMVKPGSGNCKSRRQLKRAIEQVLSREEIESSMNAKIRRRVVRTLKLLAPGAADEIVKLKEQQEREKHEATLKDAKNNGMKTRSNSQQQPAVPYIVFVGQINYNATAEDIQNYFISKGVNGRIKVRLLTDPKTHSSKGMAFVELDSAIEMHKCIALHRSSFQGKLINVEKSCGGKSKEKRQEKIKDKRIEQTGKMSETIERILTEHAATGLIQPDKFGEEFRNKVIQCGPHVVSRVNTSLLSKYHQHILMYFLYLALTEQALQAYGRVPEDKRNLAKLDQYLDRFKSEGAIALNEAKSHRRKSNHDDQEDDAGMELPDDHE